MISTPVTVGGVTIGTAEIDTDGTVKIAIDKAQAANKVGRMLSQGLTFAIPFTQIKGRHATTDDEGTDKT